MRLIIMTFITLATAAVTGFGSAWLALGERPVTGATRLGPWRAWPATGRPDVDPYGRAVAARTAALPLGAGEGVELVAEHDSDGQPLRGGCVYEITGRTPEARIWTLAATPLRPDGTAAPAGPAAPLAQPRALTSEGLLRDPDGGVRIAVAATPQPGDWIAAPPSGRFRLTLRLYDSPTGFISRPDMSEQLTPAIRRKRCA